MEPEFELGVTEKFEEGEDQYEDNSLKVHHVGIVGRGYVGVLLHPVPDLGLLVP